MMLEDIEDETLRIVYEYCDKYGRAKCVGCPHYSTEDEVCNFDK